MHACMPPAGQARALFEAPEGAPHLLPFYARVAASLAQVFPDVAPPLLRYLEEEFAALQARDHSLLLQLPRAWQLLLFKNTLRLLTSCCCSLMLGHRAQYVLCTHHRQQEALKIDDAPSCGCSGNGVRMLHAPY
jgi:hypothetical protein